MYMSFFVRHPELWVVQFLEMDLRTSVGRIRSLGSAEKIRELIARTETKKMMLEDKQAVEYALSTGRGGVYLTLNPRAVPQTVAVKANPDYQSSTRVMTRKLYSGGRYAQPTAELK